MITANTAVSRQAGMVVFLPVVFKISITAAHTHTHTHRLTLSRSGDLCRTTDGTSGKVRMDENETDGWFCGRVEMRRAMLMSPDLGAWMLEDTF